MRFSRTFAISLSARVRSLCALPIYPPYARTQSFVRWHSRRSPRRRRCRSVLHFFCLLDSFLFAHLSFSSQSKKEEQSKKTRQSSLMHTAWCDARVHAARGVSSMCDRLFFEGAAHVAHHAAAAAPGSRTAQQLLRRMCELYPYAADFFAFRTRFTKQLAASSFVQHIVSVDSVRRRLVVYARVYAQPSTSRPLDLSHSRAPVISAALLSSLFLPRPVRCLDSRTHTRLRSPPRRAMSCGR